MEKCSAWQGAGFSMLWLWASAGEQLVDEAVAHGVVQRTFAGGLAKSDSVSE